MSTRTSPLKRVLPDDPNNPTDDHDCRGWRDRCRRLRQEVRQRVDRVDRQDRRGDDVATTIVLVERVGIDDAPDWDHRTGSVTDHDPECDHRQGCRSDDRRRVRGVERVGCADQSGGVESGTLAVVTDPKLGAILTDGNGHVVYLFTVDTATASACGGSCVTTWPPLVGTPKAGTGLDATKLGTLKRSDGSVQVTYGGHPLYEHAKDAPGAATGEGANGNWFAISPAGTKA